MRIAVVEEEVVGLSSDFVVAVVERECVGSPHNKFYSKLIQTLSIISSKIAWKTRI